MSAIPETLDDLAVASFVRDGYVVLRRQIPDELCSAVSDVVQSALQPLLGPAEYEADVGYPGAPAAKEVQGGLTPRRLLHAWTRARVLREMAAYPSVVAALAQLLPVSGVTPGVMLSQCHHNCIMTKHPGYSSSTMWHQDVRYWSFDRPELISAWFALGDEVEANGGLALLPGSHAQPLPRGRLDRDLFLRPDLAANQTLIGTAEHVSLARGDVLLFHCRTLHAAGQNSSDKIKLSPVFTYHRPDNLPIPGTRSASYPSLLLDERAVAGTKE